MFPFAAALFDLDGTLVDTERLLHRAWTELARRAGADFSTFDHFGLARDPAAWHEEYKKTSVMHGRPSS